MAIGFARRSDGSTALAAVVGYLVFDAVTGAMSPYVLEPAEDPIDYGVFGGIVIGLTAALLWQRYHRIRLPPYLAFFGGRRFVPIVTACAALGARGAALVRLPGVRRRPGRVRRVAGRQLGSLGAGVYGVANRLLIPLGLHHLLNSVPWFAVGSYTRRTAETVHGDIARFLSGDPTAGAFMTGFFPIMMFALPAAALAIYQEASPGRRKLVGGVMLSARAHVVPDRGDRAARVRVHVRGVAAVPHARRADRHVPGAGERARHQGRVRLLGRRDRLHAELHGRHAPAAAACPSGSATRRSTTCCSGSRSGRFDLGTPGRGADEDRGIRRADTLAGGRRQLLEWTNRHQPRRPHRRTPMPIATPEVYAEMLDTAKASAFAFPAINVSSSQTLNAALQGFADAGSDGIVQVSTGGAEYLSGPAVKNMVTGSVAFAAYAAEVAKNYPVNIALHTDHCPKDKLDGFVRPLLDISAERVKRGETPLFQSHMWDGSAVPLEENLQIAEELLEQVRRPRRSSSRSRSAWSAARRTASRARSTRSSTPRPRTRSPPSRRSAPARRAAT